MTIISAIITFVAYRPKDLRLWEYSESFLQKHGYKNHMKDEEFLFGKAGIIDNIEEHVPESAFVHNNNNNNNNNLQYANDINIEHSLNRSMDSRISKTSSISHSITDLRSKPLLNNSEKND